MNATLLFDVTRIELARRFSGSLLGPVWPILQPLLFFSAYLVVFAFVLRAGGPATPPLTYALHLFAGLLPCLFLADACAQGVHAVTGNAAVVRNALFPPALLPARAVLVSAALQAPALAALLLALALAGRLRPAALLFPAVALCALALAAGAAYALAALHVFVRDVAHATPLLLFALIVVAPVAWTADAVPARLALPLAANPLHPFVTASQALLVAGRLPPLLDLALCPLYALLAFAAGRAIFRRLAPAFPDHL